MGNSTQVRIRFFWTPLNKDSVIKGGMSLSPTKRDGLDHGTYRAEFRICITSNDYHPYQGSLNYRTHIGGIKQYESIVILRDCLYNGALYIRKSSTAVFLDFWQLFSFGAKIRRIIYYHGNGEICEEYTGWAHLYEVFPCRNLAVKCSD